MRIIYIVGKSSVGKDTIYQILKKKLNIKTYVMYTTRPIRTGEKNGVDYYPPNGRIWCYNKATLDSLMADGRIKFGLSDDSAPKRKLYLNERKATQSRRTLHVMV